MLCRSSNRLIGGKQYSTYLPSCSRHVFSFSFSLSLSRQVFFFFLLTFALPKSEGLMKEELWEATEGAWVPKALSLFISDIGML